MSGITPGLIYPDQGEKTEYFYQQAEAIEILSVDLLNQNRALVEALKRLARSLHIEFGWHYLLDLTWIIRQFVDKNQSPIRGNRLMDAGAGVGVMQWYLAQQGAEVISVDRLDRADLALRFRSRFRVQGLREVDLTPTYRILLKDFSREVTGPFYRRWVIRTASLARDLWLLLHRPHGSGRITIYNQDLTNLVDIPDNSLDAVVTVSALEHNTIQGLEQVVKEIMRVIKPGGVLLATLTAARDQDWWHEPSSGWCLAETSLRKIFNLNSGVLSNYSKYDDLFRALCDCTELRNNLADFYFQSDKNGMPWGKWDPKYQPVGVCKVKRA